MLKFARCRLALPCAFVVLAIPMLTTSADAEVACLPVNGTMTSPFGPRLHPILKQVRLHTGVDWAAPIGTPVVAALDGTFAEVGDFGGYGNAIYLAHSDKRQTRYTQLDGFAENAVVGRAVKAGEVIGYVGSTGRSTGPHLHFELRVNGEPIDPLRPTFAQNTSGDIDISAFADALVASVGDGVSPLPSAGRGLIIDPTWLRLMRDYRPDLHNTLPRIELLALRDDLALEREMIEELLSESVTFLQGRGHIVDSGLLYLGFFLGPSAVDRVLSFDDDAMLQDVLGDAVIRANPFLETYTVSDIQTWAQRKVATFEIGANSDAEVLHAALSFAECAS